MNEREAMLSKKLWATDYMPDLSVGSPDMAVGIKAERLFDVVAQPLGRIFTNNTSYDTLVKNEWRYGLGEAMKDYPCDGPSMPYVMDVWRRCRQIVEYLRAIGTIKVHNLDDLIPPMPEEVLTVEAGEEPDIVTDNTSTHIDLGSVEVVKGEDQGVFLITYEDDDRDQSMMMHVREDGTGHLMSDWFFGDKNANRVTLVINGAQAVMELDHETEVATAEFTDEEVNMILEGVDRE